LLKESFHTVSETGITARPALDLISTADDYESKINLQYHDKTVNLKSIMSVMSLGIGKNADIVISADGEDEEAAIADITNKMKELGLV
jgi:phosphocarrier protein